MNMWREEENLGHTETNDNATNVSMDRMMFMLLLNVTVRRHMHLISTRGHNIRVIIPSHS